MSQQELSSIYLEKQFKRIANVKTKKMEPLNYQNTLIYNCERNDQGIQNKYETTILREIEHCKKSFLKNWKNKH